MDSKNLAGDYEANQPTDQCRAYHENRKSWHRRIAFFALLFSLWLGWRVFRDVLLPFPLASIGFHKATLADTSIPPDVDIEYCPPWEDNPSPDNRISETSVQFELPISSDKLFLLSRGLAGGSVNVKQGGEGDTVKVEVTAHYRYFDELQAMQACAINRGEGEKGVGIFPGLDKPPGAPHSHELAFSVLLYLPISAEGSVLNVKNFETDMPIFAQKVDDLADGVHFDSISLKAAAAPITATSLSASKAQLETAVGGISGSFNISSSLALLASNGKIDATVNLFNNPDTDDVTAFKLRAFTAPVKAEFNLASATGTGGSFAIDAATTLGPVDLDILSAPVDSALSLSAKTTIGPAKVQLHETYQGTFKLKTTLSRPRVNYDSRTVDPSGQGRKRRVDVRTSIWSTSGSATWSEEGLELGTVDLETTLAPVTLAL